MKNKVLIGVGTLAVISAVLAASTVVFAQGTGSQTFVQELAQKLGIDESKVQGAVDSIRNERRVQFETKFEDRLSQAVKDGKLTETQKQAILDKRKQLADERKSEMDSFKKMTPQERRTAMAKKRQESRTWAKDNGIDVSYLFGQFGMRGRMGIRGFGHFK